jgi:hypothetical protein
MNVQSSKGERGGVGAKGEGIRVVYTLEHEIRSLRHPGFAALGEEDDRHIEKDVVGRGSAVFRRRSVFHQSKPYL